MRQFEVNLVLWFAGVRRGRLHIRSDNEERGVCGVAIGSMGAKSGSSIPRCSRCVRRREQFMRAVGKALDRLLAAPDRKSDGPRTGTPFSLPFQERSNARS